MQAWLVVGYLMCLFVAGAGPVLALMGRVNLMAGIVAGAGGVAGMAFLRCLEEVVRRLPPPEP